jgi:outer membrane protein TolC
VLLGARIRPIFNPDCLAQARDRLSEAVAHLDGRLAKGANVLKEAETEILDCYAFPPDHWRKLRSTAKAASYRYLATVEGKNFMVTQLVAEIASSYYELLALDNQLEVLRRNIEIQQNALTIVNLEKQAARVTQLAVQRFEAEVLKNQSRQYDLEQRRIEAENRINFLLGRYPQTVQRSPQRFNAPPAVSPSTAAASSRP